MYWAPKGTTTTPAEGEKPASNELPKQIQPKPIKHTRHESRVDRPTTGRHHQTDIRSRQTDEKQQLNESRTHKKNVSMYAVWAVKSDNLPNEKATVEPKEPREPREPKEPKIHREPRTPNVHKDPRTPKVHKEPRYIGDLEETKKGSKVDKSEKDDGQWRKRKSQFDQAIMNLLKNGTNGPDSDIIKNEIYNAKMSLPTLLGKISRQLKEYYADESHKFDFKEKEFLLIFALGAKGMLQIWTQAAFMAITELIVSKGMEIDEEFREVGKKNWDCVNPAHYDYFFRVYPCQNEIKKDDLNKRIKNLLAANKYDQLAKLVIYFKIPTQVNIDDLLYELLQIEAYSDALELAKLDPDCYEFLIREAMKVNPAKAADFVKKLKLNPEKYIDLQDALFQNCIGYLLKTSKLDLIEDKFIKFPRFLAQVVERVLSKKKDNQEATCIAIRQKLVENGHITKKYFLNLLKELQEDPGFKMLDNALYTVDDYGPVEEVQKTVKAGTYWSWKDFGLEFNKNVWVVDDAASPLLQQAITEILGSPMIGIDCEFKPSYCALDHSHLSLIQISTQKHTYVFDVYALHKVPEFCKFLEELFQSPNIVKVATGFSSDVGQLKKTFKFKKIIGQKFVDLVAVLKTLFPEEKKSSLEFMVKFMLPAKQLSKGEQVSGWANRPLRKAQIHYAALDAYILLEIYSKFQAVAATKGVALDKMMEKIDFDVKEEAEKKPAEGEGEEGKAEEPVEEVSQHGDSFLFPHKRINGNCLVRNEEKLSGKFFVDSALFELAIKLKRAGHDIEYTSLNDRNKITTAAKATQKTIITSNPVVFNLSHDIPCCLVTTKDVKAHAEAISTAFSLKL